MSEQNIKAGDLFTVTQGPIVANGVQDRSYQGDVFRALVVESNHIAAKEEFGSYSSLLGKPRNRSFNLSTWKVQKVSEPYLAALLSTDKEDKTDADNRD